jgi:TonB family protein
MRGILVTASDRTLAMPAEVMRIGAWPAVDIGRAARRWLPALLASVCANLLLLYLFPVLLQARVDSQEAQPIQVTLSPAPPAEVKTEHADVPPMPKPSRVITRPEPVTPAEPAPQPDLTLEPEPQPAPLPAPVVAEVPPTEPETTTEPESPPLPKAQPLYKLTRLPALIVQHRLSYPESERALGREAEVLAEVFIDETGQVLDIVIIKSTGHAFDQAVIDTLRESRFTPGYIESEAVAVRFRIPFHFQLD